MCELFHTILFVFFLRDTPEPDVISLVFFLIIFIGIISIITYRFLKSSELLQNAETFKANFKLYGTEEREKKLFDYANSGRKRGTASEILLENFRTITPETRESILKKISFDEKESVSENTAKILSSNFMDITQKTREEILLRITEKKSEEVKTVVSEILLANFESITENIRISILSTFSHEKNTKIKENSIKTIYVNFRSIPKELTEAILLDGIRTHEVDETYIKAVISRYKNNISKDLVEYASKKLNF